MKVVEQIKPEDLPTLDNWCKGWGKSFFPPGWLPPTGFWVPGVLAAFLFRTDSKVAYIECVISNPDSTNESRRDALLAVGEAIAKTAKSEGFIYLLGLTANTSVAKAGSLAGYKISEYKYATMIKLLNGDL